MNIIIKFSQIPLYGDSATILGMKMDAEFNNETLFYAQNLTLNLEFEII